MRRNMDLVRMILTKLINSVSRTYRDLGIRDFPSEEVSYHVHIMRQEGLVEGNDLSPTDASDLKLTWKGNEFLDLSHNSNRWNRAKAIIAKVGGAPLAVWTKVLTDLTLEGIEVVRAKAG